MYELMTLKEKIWFWLAFALVSPVGAALLPILCLIVWSVFDLPTWYIIMAIPSVLIGWMIVFLSVTEARD